MRFFTSDQHFGHQNIIRYCGRGMFRDAGQMDAQIIKRYNTVVGPEDTCIMIGDFTMKSNPDYIEAILRKLNGTKILVLGNHDRLRPFAYVDIGFQSVHTSLRISLENGESAICVHDPAPACSVEIQDRWLVGHVHRIFRSLDHGRIINVGVDVWGFSPVSEADLIKYSASLSEADMAIEEFKRLDYHEKEVLA